MLVGAKDGQTVLAHCPVYTTIPFVALQAGNLAYDLSCRKGKGRILRFTT